MSSEARGVATVDNSGDIEVYSGGVANGLAALSFAGDADPTAITTYDGVRFHSERHMGHVGEAGGLQRLAGGQGALAAAADQQHRAAFVAGLALHGRGKACRVGRQVRVFIPGDVFHARRAADVQGLDLHAHVHKQRLGPLLQQLPSLFGQQVPAANRHPIQPQLAGGGAPRCTRMLLRRLKRPEG